MTPLDKHSHLITIWQTFRLTNARKLTVCNHNFMVNIHNAYNTNLYFSCYLLYKEVPCCNPKRSETHALPIVCYNTVILVMLSPRIKQISADKYCSQVFESLYQLQSRKGFLTPSKEQCWKFTITNLTSLISRNDTNLVTDGNVFKFALGIVIIKQTFMKNVCFNKKSV